MSDYPRCHPLRIITLNKSHYNYKSNTNSHYKSGYIKKHNIILNKSFIYSINIFIWVDLCTSKPTHPTLRFTPSLFFHEAKVKI